MTETSPLNLHIYKISNLALQLRFNETSILKIHSGREKLKNSFPVPKSKNPDQFRKIVNPHPQYKLLLKRRNKYLLSKAQLPIGICGGIVNKKLFDMVFPHCKREAIYSIDLKDFYPSIRYGRILKIFLSAGCSNQIAKLLTDLTTHENFLPQGFPTSTMLANICAYKMDLDHENICIQYRLTRTRWIDDIVFSGRLDNIKKAIYAINKSVDSNGFIINPSKQVFKRRNQAPEVVGLLIGKRIPRIPERIINRIQEYLELIKIGGIQNLKRNYDEDFGNKDVRKSIEGKIRYICTYSPEQGKELLNIYDKIIWK